MDELRRQIKNCRIMDEHSHFGWSSLHIAVVYNRADAVNDLLGRPETNVNCRTPEGCTSLLLTSLVPKLDLKIAKDLLNHGADPNIPNNRNVGALHLACKYNALELVQLLVRHQADVNSQDAGGCTPLHYAVENDAPALIEHLLAHKADANLTEIRGLNALMLSLYHYRNHAALLMPCTQHLNAVADGGWTAMLFAILASEVDVVRALMDRGATLAANECHYSPLQLAGTTGLYGLFELVWQRTDLALETKNFVSFVCQHCPLPRGYKHFELILKAPDVDWHVNEGPELFCNIFKREPPAGVDFEAAKGQYLDVIGWLLDRKVQLRAMDVKHLLVYFSQCRYTVEMWNIIFAKITPDITQQSIQQLIVSQQYDAVRLFITYCLHLNPGDIVDAIDLRHGIDDTFLRHWLALFTTSSQSRLEIIDRTFDHMSYSAIKILKTSRVKSLLESSRDAVRQALRDTCNTTQEFLLALETLEIPTHVKDVLRLRKPVNRNMLED